MPKNSKKYFALLLLAGLALVPIVIKAETVSIPDPLGNKYANIPDFITKGIIPALTTLIGGVSTIMLIWAGFLFLTSSGDPGRIGKARTALIWAVIGIAVAVGASVIVEIIKNVTGTTV